MNVKTVAVVPATPAPATRGGKAPLFTEATKAKILESVAKGRSLKDSGLLAGLGRDTLDNWLYLGRKEPEKYPHYAEFVEQVEVARAERRAEAVDRIIQAGTTSDKWQANAWYLERTDPETWGRKDKVEVQNDQPQQQINQVILIDADARESAFDLLRRVAGNTRPDITVGPSGGGELEAGDGS